MARKLGWLFWLGVGIVLVATVESRLASQIQVNGVALAAMGRPLPVIWTRFGLLREAMPPRTVYLRAVTDLATGAPTAAQQTLAQLSSATENELVEWRVIEAYVAVGQFEQAQQTLSGWPMDTNMLVTQARASEENGNTDLSVILTREAMRRGGGNIASLRWLGAWCQRQGLNEDAHNYWQQVVQVDPDDHYAWAQLGWLAYVMGRYEDAVVASTRALDLIPSDPVYQLRVAQAHLARDTIGDREYGIDLLKQLVSQHPALSPEPWYELGRAYSGGDAAPYFEHALALAPTNPVYQFRLAQALVARSDVGDCEWAISLLRSVLKTHPEFSEAATLLQALEKAK